MHSSALDHPARVHHSPPASPLRQRAIAGAVALACSTLLTVAMVIAPADAGLGTHEQLNLPRCGWILAMDVPCMTCGMTTAFAHAVRGSFLQSLLTQPMGFVLAIATAMTLLISLHVAVTGSNIARLLSRAYSAKLIWLMVAFAAASWVYKIVIYRGMIA